MEGFDHQTDHHLTTKVQRVDSARRCDRTTVSADDTVAAIPARERPGARFKSPTGRALQNGVGDLCLSPRAGPGRQ
jgi:hypothetical protein